MYITHSHNIYFCTLTGTTCSSNDTRKNIRVILPYYCFPTVWRLARLCALYSILPTNHLDYGHHRQGTSLQVQQQWHPHSRKMQILLEQRCRQMPRHKDCHAPTHIACQATRIASFHKVQTKHLHRLYCCNITIPDSSIGAYKGGLVRCRHLTYWCCSKAGTASPFITTLSSTHHWVPRQPYKLLSLSRPTQARPSSAI